MYLCRYSPCRFVHVCVANKSPTVYNIQYVMSVEYRNLRADYLRCNKTSELEGYNDHIKLLQFHKKPGTSIEEYILKRGGNKYVCLLIPEVVNKCHRTGLWSLEMFTSQDIGMCTVTYRCLTSGTWGVFHKDPKSNLTLSWT